MPRASPPERWALTPPFHPCPAQPDSQDRPEVLPPTDHRSLDRTGGLFSVALSVAVPKLQDDPLALPGALPFSPQPCGRGLRSPDFPPGRPSFDVGPAITRPTRQVHYTPAGTTDEHRSTQIIADARRGRPHTHPAQSHPFRAACMGIWSAKACSRLRKAASEPPHTRVSARTRRNTNYFSARSLSKPASSSMVTPSDLALSYFEPGSVPTTT